MLTISLANVHGSKDYAIVACMHGHISVIGSLAYVEMPTYLPDAHDYWLLTCLGETYTDMSLHRYIHPAHAYAWMGVHLQERITEYMQSLSR